MLRRYRDTHIEVAKWSTCLDPYVDPVNGALGGLRRSAAVDLICFPVDSTERFIDQDGHMRLTFNELEWVCAGETRGF